MHLSLLHAIVGATNPDELEHYQTICAVSFLFLPASLNQYKIAAWTEWFNVGICLRVGEPTDGAIEVKGKLDDGSFSYLLPGRGFNLVVVPRENWREVDEKRIGKSDVRMEDLKYRTSKAML